MRFCSFAALLLAGAAHAFDQQATISAAAETTQPRVRGLAPLPDGGFVSIVEHRDSIISFDRYAADGALRARAFEPETTDAGGGFYGSARLLGIEQGAIGVDRRCALLRLTSDLTLQWRTPELPGLPPGAVCYLPLSDPEGFWLTLTQDSGNLSLVRYDLAGRIRHRSSSQIQNFIGASNPLGDSDSGVYFGGSTQGSARFGVIARLGSDGAVRWRLQNEGARLFDWLMPRENGGVLAAGANGSGGVIVAGIDADGNRVVQRNFDVLRGDRILGVVGNSDSRYAVIARRELGDFSSLATALGTLVFDLPVGFECVPGVRGCAMRMVGDGEFEVVMRHLDAAQPARLIRVDRFARSVGERIVPVSQISFAAPGDRDDWLVISQGSVLRVAAADGVTANVVATQTAPLGPRLLGEYQRADVRIVVGTSASGLSVARLGRDGDVVWQRAIASQGQQGLPWSRLAGVLADSFFCFRDERPSDSASPIRCLRSSDGETALTVQPNAALQPQFAVFSIGILALIDRGLDGSAIVRRWRIADGREIGSVALPAMRTLPGDYLQLRADRYAGGSMVVVGRSIAGGQTAAWFDTNATAARAFPLTQLPLDFIVDGQYFGLLEERITGTSRRLFLRTLDTAMDRQQLNEELEPSYDGSSRDLQLIVGNGNRFVSLGSAIGARTFAVTPDWRSVIWQRSSAEAAIGYLANANRLLLAKMQTGSIGLVEWNNDGNRVAARTLACDDASLCWTNLYRQNEFGSDVAIGYSRYRQTDGRQLRSGRVALGGAATIPVSQAGIAGPWFHPGTPGQGFLVNYIGSANLIFAPWFTHRSGTRFGDQAQLVWYYLQGSAGANADVAQLDIVRNSGGRFASPPVTTPEVVGRAELRMADCDRATLSYTFNPDVENGRSGSLPWQRLGPRLRPCIRRDGSVESTGTPLADTAGFSQRQSGAWFEPATSGQGLLFEVQPPGGDNPGFVFGAWFTYDVDPGNDPARQDWFTLQAPIGAATGGRIELPISRAIGGELDRVATANTFVVGTATLTFSGCDRATMQFQFAESDLAAEHSGRSGTLLLQRAGGCE